jgi:hypothetical protein
VDEYMTRSVPCALSFERTRVFGVEDPKYSTWCGGEGERLVIGPKSESGDQHTFGDIGSCISDPIGLSREPLPQ